MSCYSLLRVAYSYSLQNAVSHEHILTEVMQYIPAVAPVISFILLLGCKWISTKSRQNPAVAKEGSEKTDVEKAVEA